MHQADPGYTRFNETIKTTFGECGQSVSRIGAHSRATRYKYLDGTRSKKRPLHPVECCAARNLFRPTLQFTAPSQSPTQTPAANPNEPRLRTVNRSSR